MSEVLLPSGSAGWITAPRVSRWTLLRLLAFPVLLLAGPVFFAHAINYFGPLIFDGIFVLAGGVAIVLYLHNERFMADRSSVSRVNSFGRTRSWPLSAIDHVDRFTVRGRHTKFAYVVFKDHAGKALFTLTGQYWDAARVEEICNRVGLRLTGDFSETVSIFELSRRLGRRAQRQMFLYVVFILLGAAAAALVFTLSTKGH